MLWYGVGSRPDKKGESVTTLADMKLWNTASREVSDWSGCSNKDFGNDPFPGVKKQCFCEPRPEYKPFRCADDGEDCMCKGTVIYGLKKSVSNPGKLADFDEVLESEWAAEFVNTTGSILCASESFGGADPLPNGDKQCYCDVEKTEIDQAAVISSKKFWQAQTA